MLIEAAGLAILAAISPTAQTGLVVTSARPGPRRNGRMILACTLVVAGLIVATDGLVGLTKKG